MHQKATNKAVAIIGGGPAGLMAADIIAQAGYAVSVYDAMPSVGRKFLLAGVGGMNITHAEAHNKLLQRYQPRSTQLESALNSFSAAELRAWVQELGIDTFIGTSQRVFPVGMKAAPLLRAWLHRLRQQGVQFFTRHRWLGWENNELHFIDHSLTQPTEKYLAADVTVLALGGASWPRLGSDGSWVSLLSERAISIRNLLPSNCGFSANWSEKMTHAFSGAPLPTIGLQVRDTQGIIHSVRGEALITQTGIEGTSIYALSAALRDQILSQGNVELIIDLLPDTSLAKIIAQLNKPRGKNSQSNFLRKQLNLPPVKLALLRELTSPDIWQDTQQLAFAIKHLSLRLTGFRPIEEAISSAGGVAFSELNEHLMLKKIPGLFCAGEMLDWEAPTGGYLLTACFATGRAAGLGVVDFLRQQST